VLLLLCLCSREAAEVVGLCHVSVRTYHSSHLSVFVVTA
jgi:hypothetical protein